MAHFESPPTVTVSRGAPASVGGESTPTIVWVRGEHDMATRVHLSVTIAQAARLDDGAIVVDLSGVTFMDLSTLGALVVARNRLLARSRRLSVRAPSARALRLPELCGLTGLMDGPVPALRPVTSAALATWVAVPAASGRPEQTDAPSRAVEATRAVSDRLVAQPARVDSARPRKP